MRGVGCVIGPGWLVRQERPGQLAELRFGRHVHEPEIGLDVATAARKILRSGSRQLKNSVRVAKLGFQCFLHVALDFWGYARWISGIA